MLHLLVVCDIFFLVRNKEPNAAHIFLLILRLFFRIPIPQFANFVVRILKLDGLLPTMSRYGTFPWLDLLLGAILFLGNMEQIGPGRISKYIQGF